MINSTVFTRDKKPGSRVAMVSTSRLHSNRQESINAPLKQTVNSKPLQKNQTVSSQSCVLT